MNKPITITKEDEDIIRNIIKNSLQNRRNLKGILVYEK